MAKTKISEYSATSADNTDISNINIAEGCSPANVNNAIRTVMAQLKDQQAGTSGDPFICSGTLTSSGTLAVTGGLTLDGAAGTSGQVMVSAGSGTPTWGNAFVAGMIMMWSGTIATIPSGWLLCNGSSGTPDLRNRFVIGAFQDTSSVAYTTITGADTQTGGTKDAIVVSHTHTATDAGHTHVLQGQNQGSSDNHFVSGVFANSFSGVANANQTSQTGTANISVSTTGSSGTNQNLPPYYALAFIMKS
jgi:microcystin-dependent protein